MFNKGYGPKLIKWCRVLPQILKIPSVLTYRETLIILSLLKTWYAWTGNIRRDNEQN